MVSIEYDHCRFATVFHCFYQIPCKLIHLIDLIHIVFPFILQCLVLDSLNLNLRVFDDLLFRIITMSLYADGHQEILLLGSVHCFHHVLNQHFIFRPSIWCGLQDIHKFLTGKCIISGIVVYTGTAIEVTTVIMQSMSSISQCAQCCCRTFRSLFFQISLKWIFSRSEETHIHTGHNLKLGIRGSGAYGWHLKISGRIILIHLMQIRACILRCCKKFCLIYIKIRL